MGDFNIETNDSCMADFSEMYNLVNLIKEPTCYKNPNSPSSIDLILPNRSNLFQKSICFETGLSDYHLMTITVMKMNYLKLKPRIISYRDYKKFRNDKFRGNFLNFYSTNNEESISYETFEKNVLVALNIDAPIKRKYLRGNHQPFMNKDLSKAIMKRSKLRNLYIKNRTEENKNNYVKQRNYCVNFLRKIKRNYYDNLNISDIKDNRKFWKTVKPCFTDKINTNEQITLVEKDDIITDESKIADIMVNFFTDVVDLLEIPDNEDLIMDNTYIDDDVTKAIVKYNNHPSIIKIKETNGNNPIFKFNHTTVEIIEDIIDNIDLNKAASNEGNFQKY